MATNLEQDVDHLELIHFSRAPDTEDDILILIHINPFCIFGAEANTTAIELDALEIKTGRGRFHFGETDCSQSHTLLVADIRISD